MGRKTCQHERDHKVPPPPPLALYPSLLRTRMDCSWRSNHARDGRVNTPRVSSMIPPSQLQLARGGPWTVCMYILTFSPKLYLVLICLSLTALADFLKMPCAWDESNPFDFKYAIVSVTSIGTSSACLLECQEGTNERRGG